MKRWKVAALACAIAAFACLLLAGCSSQEYKPEPKEQAVPASALGQNGVLRVGVNASYAPLAGKPEGEPNADVIGIDVDVARYLADEMGLTVQVVDVGNDPETALEDGKVDIVLGVDASETEGTYWKSEPYLATAVALFGTATETSIPTLDSKPKIAAQASTASSWRVTNLFGDSSLVSQDNLQAAFESVNSGTSRYVAVDAVKGTYVADVYNYNDKIIALLEEPSGFCVAVSSNNTDLQSAVATAVAKLVNGGVMDVIEAQWFGAPLNLDRLTVVKSQYADAASTASSSNSSASAASASSESAGPEEGAEADAGEEEPAQEESGEEAAQ